ncbi:MAG: tRNA (N6-threonylcarbamoyladenosine(37)-N6)-methyltransferase TrmO [Prevotella sp.]
MRTDVDGPERDIRHGDTVTSRPQRPVGVPEGQAVEIRPVAWFRSPFTSKFGIPRQSGIAAEVEGEIIFCPPYDTPDATRGIEGFSHLWLIWGFSANTRPQAANTDAVYTDLRDRPRLTVRPPRLGGNERVGVFASRSPYRPNGIGLSSVRLRSVGNGVLVVTGADLMDGTPIYDIKPYIAYTDSHEDAQCGFVDTREWGTLEVDIPDEMGARLTPSELRTIISALQQDPRPHYHDDPCRIYGMPFAGHDVRFRVEGGKAVVVEIN